MRSTIQSLVDLPTPLKVVFGVMACTTLLGVVYMLAGLSPAVIVVLLIGIAIVALLLVGYRLILKWRKKRKAKPFESDLAGNTGAVPQGVSEAASRARLDELRKKFEQGVEIFRQHGKDLYSLPWYMIVGEPGSGKTEALRHSNVGFPPGLQDELQGSGGTINMDWWFTNNAVILDTAGRLMFEEAASKSNTEWKEFLTLLRKHRPNCPVNGLMLVIPADSLIRDSADEIANKGGRIARQLDLIQRTLGVRFPVFVLVTKADLVLGFREFFDELNDPQLQHQIMGWSNSSDLDESFRPEQIEQHLQTVSKRLERRRLGLLIDPVSKEGAMARRADEVDALFAFPDSLLSIAPRLRRYLELIFTGGEWSTKPLFLRGMYFVSSMREGSALDAGLAEALGMPVDQLPEGKVWERDRSYFLRDLFIEKMFREQGLVTRTSNTSQLRRRRRTVLLGTGCAAAALLIGLTWFGSRSLSTSIGQPATFWSSAADLLRQDRSDPPYPLVVAGELGRNADDRLLYTGRDSLESIGRVPGRDEAHVVALDEEVAQHVNRQIDVPWIFRPVAWIAPGDSSNLYREERLEAGRDVFELTVLRPLASRALKSLATTENWTPEATNALVELLEISTLRTDHVSAGTIELQPLFRYVLREGVTVSSGPDQPTQFDRVVSSGGTKSDLDRLQETLNTLQGTDADWPGNVLIDVHAQPSAALRAAVDRFVRSRTAIVQGNDTNSPLGKARAFLGAMRQFKALEDQLHETYAPLQEVVPPKDTAAWTQRYPALIASYNQLEQLAPSLGGQPFPAWYQAQAAATMEQIAGEFNRVLSSLPPMPDANVEGNGEDATASMSQAERELVDMRRTVETALATIRQEASSTSQLNTELASLQEAMLNAGGGSGRFAYRERIECYQQTEALLKQTRSISEFIELPIAINALEREIETKRSDFNRLRTGNAPARIDRTITACNHVLGVIQDQQGTAIVESILTSPSLPRSASDIERSVATLADRAFQPKPHPTIPMTVFRGQGQFNQSYHQQAAPMMMRALIRVENVQRGKRAEGSADSLATARNEYGRWYVLYWRDVLEKEGGLQNFGSWTAFHNGLAPIRVADINNSLDELAEVRVQAISALATAPESWSEDVVSTREAALNQVRQEQLKVRNKADFERACLRWLENWRRLSPDADIASRRLLELELVTFNNDYVHLASDPSGGSPVDYWRAMSIGAVSTLAADINRSFGDALRELMQLRRFPLAPLADSIALDQFETESAGAPTRILSVAEVARARAAAETLRPAAGTTGGAATPGSLAVSSTLTGIAPIDDAVRQLRGSSLAEADRIRIDRMASVLQSLPADVARPQQVTITVLGVKTPSRSGMDAASLRFPYLQIVEDRQGQMHQHAEMRITGAETVIGDVEMPAGLAFNLSFEQGGRREVRTIRVAGPWAVLALIHRYDGRPSRDDARTWDVELLVPEAGSTYSLWLQMKFDVPPPPLNEWPG